MINFVISFLIILLTFLLLYSIIKISKRINLEPIIIRLITQAEKEFGTGNGTKKFDFVVQELYERFMPKFMKILFTEEEIKQLIQTIFEMIKDALHYKEEIKNG